jgi:hypothetical protein
MKFCMVSLILFSTEDRLRSMPDEPITVFVKLNYWETYRANVALLFRMFRISLAVLALVLVARVAIFVTTPSQESPLNDGVFLVGTVVLVAFGSAPLLTARRAVKDDGVRAGMTYRFSNSGVHIESAVARADVHWEGFRYLIATRSLLLLLANKTGAGAQILPIRCFKSESDLTTVLELLASKVPRKRLRLF